MESATASVWPPTRPTARSGTRRTDAGLFDEINRVSPAINGGWKSVIGPAGPIGPDLIDSLVLLPGAVYRDPVFSWRDTIGVTALEDPPGPDGQEIVFGMSFGEGPSTGVLAIERGADGLPYLLTAGGKLYRIRNWDVLDLLGRPDLRRLLVLLACG